MQSGQVKESNGFLMNTEIITCDVIIEKTIQMCVGEDEREANCLTNYDE